MPDNTLEIGISVDLSDLQAGFEQAERLVEDTASRMTSAFQEVSAGAGYDPGAQARRVNAVQHALNTMRSAEQRYLKERERLEQQSSLHGLRTWQTLGQAISSGFRSAFAGVMMGTQTLGQAFARMGARIVESFALACVEMLEKWVATHVLMKAISAVFHLDQKLANAGESASAAASNSAQATSAAFLGAANAYAYWAWNPPVAKAFASQALATGLGFAALAGAAGMAGVASAAGGWERVPEDQLALVHKNEMVLPAALAGGFRTLLSRPEYKSTAPATAPIGGAAAFPVHVNVHALDGESVNRVAGQLGRRIGDMSMQRFKRFLRTKGVMA